MTLRPGTQNWYDLVEQYNPRTGNWLSDTKDILIRFLQGFFNGMPVESGLFHFEPGEETGSTSETTSELIITDAGAVNTDTVEKRPVIIISRGSFAYGDTSFDGLLNESFASGTHSHTDLLSGTFAINCISRSGLEAEKLALLVAKGIRIYKEQLQNAGFFSIGTHIQIGQESPPGSLIEGDNAQEDYINVPVYAPVFYQESWTVSQEAELLKKINFIAYHVATRLDGSLVYPDALDEDGNPVEESDGVIVSAWTVQSS